MSTGLYDPVTLLASAVRTVSADGGWTDVPVNLGTGLPLATALQFVFDVSAAATAGTDTLDVKVQMMLDGTNPVDVVHFTQAVGNGGTKRYFEKVLAGGAEAGFENAAALTAGNTRNLIGKQMRAVAAIVDGGGADQSFTFSVVAVAV